MNKAFTTMVAGALLLGAAVPALAQDKPLGLSLRAGIVFPTDDGVKDASNAWVGAGVDFKLGSPIKMGDNSVGGLALSLDYAGKAGLRNVPITINYIARNHQFYAFAGAGVSFIRNAGEDLTSFAYEGGAGYDFGTGPSSFFLEAKYIGSSSQSVNGIGVYLGVRF